MSDNNNMPQFNRRSDIQDNPNIVRQIGLGHMGQPLKVPVSLDVVAQIPTFNAAVSHCVNLSGLDRKRIYGALKIDPGTWSKIESGKAAFDHDKLEDLYDLCGNEAPLIWQMNSRGYDWASVRKKQSELERQLAEKDRKLADYERTFRLMFDARIGAEARS
jgi:hypothetical protein